MDTSVETENAEDTTTSGGADPAENLSHDASRSSSPQDGIRDSSPQDGGEDSSPPGGNREVALSPANARLEKLLSGKNAGGAESPTPETAEGEAAPEGDPAQPDERTGTQAQPKPPAALSQPEEQQFNKSFSDRPEWQQAMKIAKTAGPEQEKTMRQALRGIFQREQGVLRQVDKLKPAAERAERIFKSLGNETAVENSVRLIELFAEGHPEAERMLEDLLTDFRSRTGKVLSSPDLIKRRKEAQQRLDDGLMTEEDFQQAEQDLTEIEMARAGRKSATEKTKAREQQDAQAQLQQAEQALVTAVHTWEKSLRDPDYPRIQDMVLLKAGQMVTEEVNRTQQDMTPKRLTEILNEARAAVKKTIGGFQKPVRGIRPPPDGDGSSERLSEKEPDDPAQAILWRKNRGRR